LHFSNVAVCERSLLQKLIKKENKEKKEKKKKK
jgi:hypothetical protein